MTASEDIARLLPMLEVAAAVTIAGSLLLRGRALAQWDSREQPGGRGT